MTINFNFDGLINNQQNEVLLFTKLDKENLTIILRGLKLRQTTSDCLITIVLMQGATTVNIMTFSIVTVSIKSYM